jgi:hypothetical protein
MGATWDLGRSGKKKKIAQETIIIMINWFLPSRLTGRAEET